MNIKTIILLAGACLFLLPYAGGKEEPAKPGPTADRFISGNETPIADPVSEKNFIPVVKYVSALDNLNIRERPDAGSPRLGTLAFGTRVEVIGEDSREIIIDGIKNRWLKVRTPKFTGWCFGAWLISDEETRERLLGNWAIYEQDGEDYFSPKRGSGPGVAMYATSFGFKDDYFFMYDPNDHLGGVEMSWSVENNRLHLRPESYFNNYSGTYSVVFHDERHITLTHANGSVYKCSRGDVPYFETVSDAEIYIQSGGNLELRDNFDNTMLIDNISHGKVEQAIILLEAGVPVDDVNIYGQTALHYAARMGFFAVVSALLQKGADINSKDKWGQTPLDMTIASSYIPHPGVDRRKTKVILEENGAVYGAGASYQKK